jgi:hypothetical protein
MVNFSKDVERQRFAGAVDKNKITAEIQKVDDRTEPTKPIAFQVIGKLEAVLKLATTDTAAKLELIRIIDTTIVALADMQKKQKKDYTDLTTKIKKIEDKLPDSNELKRFFELYFSMLAQLKDPASKNVSFRTISYILNQYLNSK